MAHPCVPVTRSAMCRGVLWRHGAQSVARRRSRMTAFWGHGWWRPTKSAQGTGDLNFALFCQNVHVYYFKEEKHGDDDDDNDDDDDDEHLALFIFTLRYFRLSFLASKFTEFHVVCSYILYNSNKNR